MDHITVDEEFNEEVITVDDLNDYNYVNENSNHNPFSKIEDEVFIPSNADEDPVDLSYMYKERRFACGSCSDHYSTFEELQNHCISLHLGPAEYLCQKCLTAYAFYPEFEIHQNNDCDLFKAFRTTTEDEQPCQKTEIELDEDIGARKRKLTSFSSFISNDDCVKETKKCKIDQTTDLRDETNDSDSESDGQIVSKEYTCESCGTIQVGRETFIEHCKLAHNRFPCLFCCKTFKQKKSLEHHAWVHTGTKPFPCPQCSKSFTREHAMRQHLANAHKAAIEINGL